MKIIGNEPDNMDDLARSVMKVISFRTPILGFAWNVRHGDVSNTHYCPESGVTNWGGRNSKVPRSYPGWTGRVWIRYAPHKKDIFGSDSFSQTLTYPGTGGGGCYDGPFKEVYNTFWKRFLRDRKSATYPEPDIYSYDYRFFDDDWPLIGSMVSQQKMLGKLSGKQVILHHMFEWQDPDTVKKDQEFIEECRILSEKENEKQSA